MKQIYFLLLALAVAALCSCATNNPGSSVATTSLSASPAATSASTAEMERTVTDLEKKMWELTKNKQAEEYKKFLAPGFRGIHADGIRDREQDAQSLLLGETKEYTLSDFNVTFPNLDTAVLTYKGALKGTFKGVDSSGTYYCSSVWVKQNGDWKNILYAESKEEQPKK